MEQKKTHLNSDIIAQNIEMRMDKISAGDLPFAAAAELLSEIKNYVARLNSAEAERYTPYVEAMQERIERHYLIYGLNNEQRPKDL